MGLHLYSSRAPAGCTFRRGKPVKQLERLRRIEALRVHAHIVHGAMEVTEAIGASIFSAERCERIRKPGIRRSHIGFGPRLVRLAVTVKRHIAVGSDSRDNVAKYPKIAKERGIGCRWLCECRTCSVCFYCKMCPPGSIVVANGYHIIRWVVPQPIPQIYEEGMVLAKNVKFLEAHPRSKRESTAIT